VRPKIERAVLDMNKVYSDPTSPKPCQYIAGAPSADDSCKCGRHVKAGTSWCPNHYYWVYRETPGVDPNYRQMPVAKTLMGSRWA
jgi:hypothetical protein